MMMMMMAYQRAPRWWEKGRRVAITGGSYGGLHEGLSGAEITEKSVKTPLMFLRRFLSAACATRQ
jgi:hypothetical protein